MRKKFKFRKDLSVLIELNNDITTDGRRNVLISSDPLVTAYTLPGPDSSGQTYAYQLES